MAILGYENDGKNRNFRRALGPVIYDIIQRARTDSTYTANEAAQELKDWLLSYPANGGLGVQILAPLQAPPPHKFEVVGQLTVDHAIHALFDKPDGENGGLTPDFREATRVVIPMELPIHMEPLPDQKGYLGDYFMKKCR